MENLRVSCCKRGRCLQQRSHPELWQISHTDWRLKRRKVAKGKTACYNLSPSLAQATSKTLAQQEERLKKMETIGALQETNRMLKMDRDKLEQELQQAQARVSPVSLSHCWLWFLLCLGLQSGNQSMLFSFSWSLKLCLCLLLLVALLKANIERQIYNQIFLIYINRVFMFVAQPSNLWSFLSAKACFASPCTLVEHWKHLRDTSPTVMVVHLASGINRILVFC